MKPAVRYIIASVLVAGLFAGTAALVHRSREAYDTLTCKTLDVSFRDSLKFIREGDIKNFIEKSYGRYIGRKLDSIDLTKIENLLEKKSSVMSSTAWTTADGILHVSITQRAPAVRFMDGDSGFYVDAGGYIFPLNKNYTAPVITISGHIPVDNGDAQYKGEARTAQERKWISDVIAMTGYINGSKAWRKSISAIEVTSGGDIEVSLSRGSEKFIFGSPEDIEDKFSKIEKYYGYIVPDKGDDYYGTVNLKYKQQIICRQKDI